MISNFAATTQGRVLKQHEGRFANGDPGRVSLLDCQRSVNRGRSRYQHANVPAATAALPPAFDDLWIPNRHRQFVTGDARLRDLQFDLAPLPDIADADIRFQKIADGQVIA